MSNCKVIALTNQKGGVGKTTTAVNLGVSLVQQGKKVLLIDADAQANLTMALGYNRPDDIPITLSTVMQNIIDDKTLDASQGIIHHREGVDLLPSNIELSGFEVRLINAMSRERVLKTYVNEVKKNYDYVLIDCMPSLGMITINALAAADSVIIPTQPHYLSAKGLELIAATSENHINAMDMNSDYGDGANPVILKSEFILSLCEQLIGGTNLGAKQKSIIDRCTASVYRYYQQGNYMGTPPTLQDFREELLKQNEPEAQEIALAIELFTDGSLNTFAKHTNVDTHSRLICYDILDLGKQLQPIGMLVVLDSILNRITQNRAKGRNTFIFIDEIYLLFQHEYSANFLFTLWKRVRKYGAYCTGITQNVDDLLQSHTARTMLANSEFIIMLNQASTDRLELAKLLNISDLQMSYITNVGAGQGLLKVGSSLVPFVNKFPRNTELYKLMTTKFGEV